MLLLTIFSTIRKIRPYHLLLSLLGIVIAIFVAETFLRITNIVPMFPGLTERSALLGWEYIPGASANYKSTEFDTDVKINSQGFRGQTVQIPKPAGTKRIAALGDSFVAGLQVEEDQLLTSRLQNELRRQNSWEVLNFGVSGYGLDQKFLMLKERIWKFQPDVVLLFTTANDVNDIRRNAILSGANGTLTFKSFPADNPFVKIAKRLLRKSHIANLIYVKYLAPPREGGSGGPLEVQVAQGQKSEEIEKYMDLAKAIIMAADNETKKISARLIVVLGADYVQSNPKYAQELPESDKINSQISEFAKRQNIEVIDLLPLFREKIAAGEKLFFAQNQHWNENGHKLVAEILERHILPPSPPHY